MATSEEIQSAMRYLRLVIQNLESTNDTTYTTNRSLRQDEDDTASEVTIISIFDATQTSNSSDTASTTNSDILLDVPIDDSAPFAPFSIDDMKEAAMFIARRVTVARFAEITIKAFGQQAWIFQDAHQLLNLSNCHVSGRTHQFEEVRRCHRCDTQLCRDCEKCILKNCILTGDEPEQNAPSNLDHLAAAFGVNHMQRAAEKTGEWQPRDSLAAKRISANCHREKCYRHIIRYPPLQCRCTNFLVKAMHSCDTGEFHFCHSCYGHTVCQMARSNTKTITFRTAGGGHESLAQYTCSAGHPCDHTRAVCKICLGTCAKTVVNDLSSFYKVNGGGEGDGPGWNNGICPWMFSLIPGVEGSFIKWNGR